MLTHYGLLAVFLAALVFGVLKLKRLLQSVPTPAHPRMGANTLSDDAKSVRHALSKTKYLENIDTRLAEKALNQFDQILERQKQFSKSLDLRFERTELAYSRYSEAVAQVGAAVLEQLKRTVEIFNQLSVMNLKQVEDPARLEMGKKLQADLAEYLRRNESAITELDRLILALNEVKTSKSGGAIGSGDSDALLSQLQELADRAKKYSL